MSKDIQFLVKILKIRENDLRKISSPKSFIYRFSVIAK